MIDTMRNNLGTCLYDAKYLPLITKTDGVHHEKLSCLLQLPIYHQVFMTI